MIFFSDNTIKHELNQNSCRIIPINGECTGVDPRLRIHSARLRLKVRQLVLERLSTNDLIDRNDRLTIPVKISVSLMKAKEKTSQD